MKRLLLLTVSLYALADPASKTYERAIDRYENQACDKARKQARERFDIIEMDAQCRCERTDSREWQCDIGFTHSGKRGN
jgi:hypothetical protein